VLFPPLHRGADAGLHVLFLRLCSSAICRVGRFLLACFPVEGHGALCHFAVVEQYSLLSHQTIIKAASNEARVITK
jgi:hypothetical protein